MSNEVLESKTIRDLDPKKDLDLNYLSIKNSKTVLRENSLIEPPVKNPFYHDLNLKASQKIQLIIGGIILMPIRLIFIAFIVFIAIIVGVIMVLGLSEESLKQKPLSGWRNKARGVLRFLGRAIAFGFGFHSIKKFGKRATRDECTIFVAGPHTTFYDAFLFFILGLPTAISRAENGKLPIVGRVVRAAQPILVTREDSKNKQVTIQSIISRADPKSAWPQVLIFPEGTTTNGSCLISFKAGAFIPKLPVQPVVIRYKNKIDTITWTWQGLGAFQVALLTLCQFNNKMEVHYLPVYYPDEKEKLKPLDYAINVRSKMAEFLNVITTNHSYEDCRLMCNARKLNLPFESAIIEFSQISTRLGIKYDNVEELLKEYATYASKNDGKMTIKEFCEFLKLPENENTRTIFGLYDRNKDGKIDFREFIIGLSLISRPNDITGSFKLAFKMFDKYGKNNIKLEDFQSIMYSHFSIPKEESTCLFDKIDVKKQGYITFDEFYAYASKTPEYSNFFRQLEELKILKSNLDYSKLAKSSDNVSESEQKGDGLFEKVKQTSSNISLTKRPQSERNRINESQNSEIKHSVSNENVNNHITKSNLPKIE